MERLTSVRCNGIKVGYWSPAKKEELVQRLGAYEDTGLTPEEIMDVQDFELSNTKKYLCELEKHRWIPVEERLPEYKVNPTTKDAYVYPVTVDLNGVYDVRYYSFCRGHWYNQGPKPMDNLVIAWMPLPEPYME